MNVKKQVSADNKVVTISVEERFDFSAHQAFKSAYVNENASGSLFILDLSKASYMDSSALGMILLLKDHVENVSGQLKIFKPNDAVNKILEIAQFHRLMTIER
ncbi:STAS domain-containing protein [Thalassotalea sp. 1_MG-2023]|uniref:STAS domain-containing protein n=1 Tax=Thalassotalea sp. 1_MG-2023 TaxID=3062680 RepID=UPI0026E1963B|nr:STAS domain-containing protein [Thalassotalea sp. 1_MG-2023]MDO6426962.1 STAS domain-containing protein [Thalassotalea sp. 1_MG-2023]